MMNNFEGVKDSSPCPLCFAEETKLYFRDLLRAYRACPCCSLVFADPSSHLEPEEEKARYDFHRNDPNDQEYRLFLARLAHPLLEFLKAAHSDLSLLSGLDFGSGPGPTLSVMLAEHGLNVKLFDPYYAPFYDNLREHYDFICCTETVEHFYSPAQEFQLLLSLLKSKAILAIMTKITPTQEAFKTWHYKNDPTHVCFFSKKTFLYLAKQHNLHLKFVGSDIVFLIKQN